MRKYPIFYKGNKYEVRWSENEFHKKIKVYLCKGIIRIPLALIWYPDHITNKYRNYLYEDSFVFSGIQTKDENYYIKQAEVAVKRAYNIQEEISNVTNLEKSKLIALRKWNGEVS